MSSAVRRVINLPTDLIDRIDRYAALEGRRVRGLRLSRSAAAHVLIMAGLRARLGEALTQVTETEIRRELEALGADLL